MRPGSEFGERLTALRKARGLTQVQLAELLKTSQRAISHYETKAEFPPAQVIIDLAGVLEVSTDELLGAAPHRRDVEREPITPDTQRLWRRFQRLMTLTEKDKRAVIRLINSLAGVGAE